MRYNSFYIGACISLSALNGLFAQSNKSLLSAWVSGWCLAFAAAKIITILKGE